MTDQMIQAARRAKPTDELGDSGLSRFFGQVSETYLPELRYPYAYAKYSEMLRRDPTIASLINAIKLLSRTATWTVEPAGTTDADQRAADFLTQCLGDMSITIEDAVEDMLSAIPFGWAWSEIVYKRRKGARGDAESKYDDNAIGWRKFAPRRQSSFSSWDFDESGGVQGLWQVSQADGKRRYMPVEKSLHFIAQRDMGNPEGFSILEPIYEPWHFVKNLQIINGIGFERSFVGLPVFEYAENYTPSENDLALVREIGRGLRVDERAYVGVPAGIKFRLETTSNSNASTLLETIKQYRIWMLMVVLADFLALGTVSSGGSYALGQDKSELFLMAVDGWLDKIAHPDKQGVLNRYAVPRLFAFNPFPGMTDFPRIKHSSVQKPNLPALSAYLSSLQAFIQPDPALEAALRRMADLPEADTQSEQTFSDAAPASDVVSGDNAGDVPPAPSGTGDGNSAPLGRGPNGAALLQAEREFRRALREVMRG